ncbi:MAG: DUF4492 domain-containing protein [Bacteroidaceae bacterium]
MKVQNSILYKVIKFYRDGFREMTIGRTLWLIILIKLFLIFVVLRVFFFQPVLSGMDTAQKENHVARELIEKGHSN